MERLNGFDGEITVYCLGIFSAVVLIKLLWTFTRDDDTATDSESNLFLQTARPSAVRVSPSLSQTERENGIIEINHRNEVNQMILVTGDFENEYFELIENDVIESESTVQSNEPIETPLTDSATNKPQISEGLININLQYLDGRIRVVQSLLQENFGDFKRKHFSRELSFNNHIDFMFMGKILLDNEASLSSLGFRDNCIVHCQTHCQVIEGQDIEGHIFLNVWVLRVRYIFREMWNIFLFSVCLVLLIIFVIFFIQVYIFRVLKKYFEPIIYTVGIFFGLYNAEQEYLMR